VAAYNRRPVELMYWRDVVGDEAPPVNAICLRDVDVDVIIIDGSVSAARQLHSAAHEAAHLVFGHEPMRLDGVGGNDDADDPELGRLTRLMPEMGVADGSDGVRPGILARSAFTDPQEWMAELLADAIGRIAGYTPLVATGTRTDPDGRVLDRLVRVLGPTQRLIR
jgi:hypothetical protein